jgi:hypothetical protein
MTLTICGSYRNRELKEKYQAYYTTKYNLVLMPIKYVPIKEELVKTKQMELKNAEIMAKIHDKKIDLCDAIIVVTGDDGYYGFDTAREILSAKNKGKRILLTYVPDYERPNYYCNYDKNYPLYMLKEE